ncbi:MAG: hypothetical protein AAGA43_04620 [Bacteroidota bacterium]
MFKKSLTLIAIVSFVFGFEPISSQELNNNISYLDIDELPEYVVVICEMSTSIAGIMLVIPSKGSEHESALDKLEEYLTAKNKLNVRNQTDLLNHMSKLGFEYVDAYTASQSFFNRTGMVFRKKARHRK